MVRALVIDLCSSWWFHVCLYWSPWVVLVGTGSCRCVMVFIGFAGCHVFSLCVIGFALVFIGFRVVVFAFSRCRGLSW